MTMPCKFILLKFTPKYQFRENLTETYAPLERPWGDLFNRCPKSPQGAIFRCAHTHTHNPLAYAFLWGISFALVYTSNSVRAVEFKLLLSAGEFCWVEILRKRPWYENFFWGMSVNWKSILFGSFLHIRFVEFLWGNDSVSNKLVVPIELYLVNKNVDSLCPHAQSAVSVCRAVRRYYDGKGITGRLNIHYQHGDLSHLLGDISTHIKISLKNKIREIFADNYSLNGFPLCSMSCQQHLISTAFHHHNNK